MPRPRGGHGGRAGGRGADQGGRGRDQAEAGRQDGEGVARGQALPGPQNLSGGDLQHPDLPPDLRVQEESHKELGEDSDVCTDKDCKLAWLRGRHFSISADLAVASWCCLLARMVTEVGFIFIFVNVDDFRAFSRVLFKLVCIAVKKNGFQPRG